MTKRAAQLEPRLWSSTSCSCSFSPSFLPACSLPKGPCMVPGDPRAVLTPVQTCDPHRDRETFYHRLHLPKFIQRALPHPLSPPQKRSQASFITPTSHKATSSFLSRQRPEPITQWEGGQGLGMVPLNPSTQQTDIRELEANPVDTEGNQTSHDFHQYLPQTMLCGFLPDT